MKLSFSGKELDRKVLDWLLGFAGGVMLAASYQSQPFTIDVLDINNAFGCQIGVLNAVKDISLFVSGLPIGIHVQTRQCLLKLE